MTITDNPDFILVKASFPMFGANIQRLWGSNDFFTYIKELVKNADTGTKTGFPRDVLDALQRLDALHNSEHHSLLPHLDSNEDLRTVSQNFPAISESIRSLWGRKDLGPYMSNILNDTIGENSKGFPFETLTALHSLAGQHNKEFGHLFPNIDIWNKAET